MNPGALPPPPPPPPPEEEPIKAVDKLRSISPEPVDPNWKTKAELILDKIMKDSKAKTFLHKENWGRMGKTFRNNSATCFLTKINNKR